MASFGSDGQTWCQHGLRRRAFSHCIHCTDTKLVVRAGLKQVDGNWAFWYWCWVDSGPRRLDERVDVVANHRWTAVVLRSIPRQRARTVCYVTKAYVQRLTRQPYDTTAKTTFQQNVRIFLLSLISLCNVFKQIQQKLWHCCWKITLMLYDFQTDYNLRTQTKASNPTVVRDCNLFTVHVFHIKCWNGA